MNHVVIVAGGKGLRMGGDTPKQYLPLGGRPVIMRTIDRFMEYDPHMHVVLVLPAAHHDYWHGLCRQYSFTTPHTVACGGATRFHSSQSGVRATEAAPGDIIAIHDGVRPFVSVEVIARCFEEARRSGAAIPVLPLTDTLRFVGAGDSQHNVLRTDYRVVQTPQTFRASLLAEAFELPFSEAFTDDASVVEAAGHAVAMVEGNRENIKLTPPYDLLVAAALLSHGHAAR